MTDLTLLNGPVPPRTGATDAKSPNGVASGLTDLQAAKVKELAQQFEGMLLLQMVQQMRKSLTIGGNSDGGDSSQDGLGSGLMSGTGTMNDTMDAAFAQAMAQQGGFGLSTQLLKSLQQQIGAAAGGNTGLAMGAQLQQLITAAQAQGLAMGSATPGLTLDSSTPGLTIAAPTGPAAPAPAATVPAAPAAGAGEAVSGAAGSAAAPTQAPAGPLVPNEAQVLPDLNEVMDAAVNSPYGWRRDPFNGDTKFHGGVDLRAAYGTEVPVVGPGVVKFAGDQGGYGLTVLVQHADGIETRYAHLSSLDVQTGQQVTAGQAIGRVGMTGRATGPHLHFEVLENGKRLNPEQVALELDGKFKSRGTNAD